MRRSLEEYVLRGVKTTIPFMMNIMMEQDFQAGRFDTSYLDTHPDLYQYEESEEPEDSSVGDFRSNRRLRRTLTSPPQGSNTINPVTYADPPPKAASMATKKTKKAVSSTRVTKKPSAKPARTAATRASETCNRRGLSLRWSRRRERNFY